MGYKIIVLVLLFLLVAHIYGLGGPSGPIAHFVKAIADIPALDARYAHDPAVFAFLTRALYLLAIIGVIKLLVSRKKEDDE